MPRYVITGKLREAGGGLPLSHVTHPGGFVQQELEGVVCGLGGLELGVTQ